MSESCLTEICNNTRDENECLLLLCCGKSDATRKQATNIPRAVTIVSSVQSHQVSAVHLAWMHGPQSLSGMSPMEHLSLFFFLQPSSSLLFLSPPPPFSSIFLPILVLLMERACCQRIITGHPENTVVCTYNDGISSSSHLSGDIDKQASVQDCIFCIVVAKLNHGTRFVFLYAIPPPCAIQIMQSGRSWQYNFNQCKKKKNY